MFRYSFFCLCFLFINCVNVVSIDDSDYIDSLYGFNNVFILKKTKKPYVLKSEINIPENKTLIISDGVKITVKKGGSIVNNGFLIFGNNSDSLFFYKNDLLNNYESNYNIVVDSKNKNTIISGGGNFNIKNSFFKNVSIKSGGNFNIKKSLFINSNIELYYSEVFMKNSFFENLKLTLTNSVINLNKNIFINSNDSFYINNSKNFNINNCYFLNNNGFVFSENFNGNILNNIFFKNKKTCVFNKNKGYFKLYNNLFINNENVINKSDSCNLYILNNTIDNNSLVINIDTYKNFILSKNNIYSYNKNINNNLTHSYCISNTDSLKGYFNKYADPLYINKFQFNYKLKYNSEALRSGNNNINLGANLNNLYNIKYLK